MGDVNRGGTPAGARGDGPSLELDAVWGTFEYGLAAYLAAMVEPDHLLVELPDTEAEGDGCPPYVQFAGLDDGQIRAEISGNAYVLTPYELGDEACERLRLMGWRGNDVAEKNWYVERLASASDQIADEVVFALRALFGVPHPDLLTYRAWGPASHGTAVLGICASDDVPMDEPQAPGAPVVARAMVVEPDCREDLLRAVEGVLRSKFEEEPTVDGDGDFVLHHLGQRVWVRVRSDQPAVEIMARVAHDVYSRRATAVELGLLNRDNLWARWTLRERTVWQSIMVPGMPFAPALLDAMLDLFFEAMTATRDDLALRLRAKVA
jgi:hypothetical protein